MPLRRSFVLLVTGILVALAGGAVALVPKSSGQSPGTQSPACKPANSQRLPLAKGLTVYAAPNPLTAGGPVRVFGALIVMPLAGGRREEVLTGLQAGGLVPGSIMSPPNLSVPQIEVPTEADAHNSGQSAGSRVGTRSAPALSPVYDAIRAARQPGRRRQEF